MDKVTKYNQAVHSVAKQFNLQCIDVESAFLLDDGSIDTSLFHRDRLHLSPRGTSALLKTISAIVPILRRQQSKMNRGRQTRHHHHQSQSRHRHGARKSHSQVACYNCGVSGHVQQECRHKDQSVICHTCGASGHKAKYCEQSDATYYNGW